MSDRDIAVKGGLWTSSSMIVTMLSQLLRVVILTRFLSKSDFGIVSISTMVIGLCLAFADLGFSSIVMYKHDLKDEDFSSLYWIQFFLYGFIASIMVLASSLIASIYEEPELTNVIAVSSLTILCLSSGQLYESVLQKHYFFKSIALRNISTNVLSIFFAWYLAWRGYGVYSMIFSTMFQSLVYNIWNLVVGVRLRKLKFCIHFEQVKPLLKMGMFQTYTRICDYFSSQLDVIIIGKFLGMEALGGYGLAKQLMSRLGGFIRSVFSQVTLPLLSNHNEDADAVKAKFLMVIKFVSYMCFPICMTTAVFSKDIVQIVYGNNYLDIAPLVAIFSILTAMNCSGCFFDILGIAKGRMDLNFMSTIYRIILSTVVIVIMSHVSIEAVVWGQVLVGVLMTIVVWKIIVNKTYPIPFMLYFIQFSKVLFIAVLVGSFFYYFYSIYVFPIQVNGIILLVVKITFYLLSLSLIYYLFLKKEYMSLYRLIRKKK